MKTKIVGITFNGRQETIEMIEKNNIKELELVRDKDNEFDKNAIMVIANFKNNWRRQVGYLKKELAEQLAEPIDKGIKYACKIIEITGKEKENRGVNIEIEKLEKEIQDHPVTGKEQPKETRLFNQIKR